MEKSLRHLLTLRRMRAKAFPIVLGMICILILSVSSPETGLSQSSKKTARQVQCTWGLKKDELNLDSKNQIVHLRKSLPVSSNLWSASSGYINSNLAKYRHKVKLRFPAEHLNPEMNLRRARAELALAINPQLKPDLAILDEILAAYLPNIRPLNCLESLIISSLLSQAPKQEKNIESLTFILENSASRKQLLIYSMQFSEDQKPFLKPVLDKIAEEISVHWSLRQVIHGHPHPFDENGALGTNHLAPRFADIGFLKENLLLFNPRTEFVTTDYLYSLTLPVVTIKNWYNSALRASHGG